MFDGLSRIGPSGVPRPIPPRPAPMDVRAMLPVLRAEAAEIAVKFLAVAAAQNAIAVTQWLVMNWAPTYATRATQRAPPRWMRLRPRTGSSRLRMPSRPRAAGIA
jgi:hypothetical protein